MQTKYNIFRMQTLCLQIFHNLVEVCFDNFFQLSNNKYNLHRHCRSIKPLNKPSTDGYRNFFQNKMFSLEQAS